MSGFIEDLSVHGPGWLRGQQAIDGFPYVITGVANIRNPTYNIPTDQNVDVSSAVNAVLARGVKRLEWDYDYRKVSNTLIFPSSNISIVGQGKFVPSIIWAGGDQPIIACPNYSSLNAAGVSNCTLRDMQINDGATSRVNNWSIDLTNGNGNILEAVFLNNSGGLASAATDKFGVAFGLRRGSSYSGATFLPRLQNSRLAGMKIDFNTTDWYAKSNEIWANSRDFAIRVGGGGSVLDNQIVPGASYGVYLLSDTNSDIELLNVLGGYFDGSALSIFTGIGIGGNPASALIGSEICTEFWHLNKEGIRLQALRMSTLNCNFRNCDSDDTGEPDIYLQTMHGNKIDCRHYRDTTAPKKTDASNPNGGAARTNLSSPIICAGDIGFPKTTIVAPTVGVEAAYITSVYTNKDAIDVLGGSYKTQLARSNLPNATQYIERTLRLGTSLYFSDGASWRDLKNATLPTLAPSDFNAALTVSADYWISNTTGWTNAPSGFSSTTAPWLFEVFRVSDTYTIQRLSQPKSPKGSYTRAQEGGVWSAWA